ncbi:response regulator [Methylovulum miyakonense]|uniref:response regulator n=1 Tax=Methylovulum miyakonense TaxID=645578 RepID=UPI00039A1D54
MDMEKPQIRRILLIENDVFFVGLLSLVLTKSGYGIISANNGKDAVKVLSEQPVDLIILDLMMPEMDGLAFLHWLREEANATTPAIVLTGMVAADTEQHVLEAGGDALLYKPIQFPELLSKIKQIEQLM